MVYGIISFITYMYIVDPVDKVKFLIDHDFL